MTKPPLPPEQVRTSRELLLQALAANPLSARQLSQQIGISERDVTSHLLHLKKSLKNRGQRLLMTPPHCLDCSFVFQKRERLTRPGRCPACRSTHLSEPLFSLDQTK